MVPLKTIINAVLDIVHVNLEEKTSPNPNCLSGGH